MDLNNAEAIFKKLVPSLIKDNEELINYLVRNNYFTAPSSRDFHGAYIGGNFEHSFEVTKCLLKYTERLDLQWERDESPYVVGLFHDLCKIDLYKFTKDENGNSIIVHNDLADKRHAEKSIDMIKPFIDLTEEEELCILHHMGAFRGKEVFGAMHKAIKKYPNVWWTHVADMEASTIKGI